MVTLKRFLSTKTAPNFLLGTAGWPTETTFSNILSRMRQATSPKPLRSFKGGLNQGKGIRSTVSI